MLYAQLKSSEKCDFGCFWLKIVEFWRNFMKRAAAERDSRSEMIIVGARSVSMLNAHLEWTKTTGSMTF